MEYGFHPGPATGSTNDDYKLSMKELKRSVPADGTAASGSFTRLVIDDAENDATKTAIKKLRASDKRAWFGDRDQVRANADAVDLTNDDATKKLRDPKAGLIAWVDGRQYYTDAAAMDDTNTDFVTGSPAALSFGLKNYRGRFNIGDTSVTRDEESVARPWIPLRVHLPLLSRTKGLYDTPDPNNLTSMNLPAVGIGLGATWLFTSSDENTWIHEVGHHRHLEHASSGPGAKPALHDSQANDLHLANANKPAVTTQGAAGTKKYGYRIIATDGANAVSGLSQATTIATGATTLNATNFNRLTWPAFAGATQYQIYRTSSDGTPATTGLIGTIAGTTFDDTGLAGGAAAVAPPKSWSAVVNSDKPEDRTWDRHCVMSYAGCGGEYPPSNKEYLCGKCLLRHSGWKVSGMGHPGTKVTEP